MDAVPRVFRVVVTVADGKKAGRFYGELFGIKGRPVGGGRTYYDCGPVIFATLEAPGRPGAESVYFAVDDLDAVHARARKLRCLSKEDVHGEPAGECIERPWGERSFYAEDPFGNGLCFVDSRTLFTGR